jgi:hypothetical protein
MRCRLPPRGSMAAVDPSTRVCPFCGERPGQGIFCAACGRNLAHVERLPTAREWSGAPDLAARVAGATEAFLAAMRAAGEPGVKEVQAGKPPAFGRVRRVRGWVVRPVDREDFEGPRRYEPGLFLTVDGRYHRLDSELRGWGQRDFPSYHLVASRDPIDAPVEERLLEELVAARAAL